MSRGEDRGLFADNQPGPPRKDSERHHARSKDCMSLEGLPAGIWIAQDYLQSLRALERARHLARHLRRGRGTGCIPWASRAG